MLTMTTSRHHGRKLVEEGALLLDVRTPDEFREKHIERALNIPVQELANRLGELGPKARSVVVYCRSGARSALAATLIKNAGYEVLDIGGIGNW